jgi:hypothetical protein
MLYNLTDEVFKILQEPQKNILYMDTIESALAIEVNVIALLCSCQPGSISGDQIYIVAK